jgi:uncharacterized protein YyaL (SSP411 family)
MDSIAHFDADSEGEEGKFYVWNKQEVMALLGDQGDLACEYFDITDQGNWEGRNILRVRLPLEEFADKKKLNIDRVKNIVQSVKEKLLEKRSHRIRPQLDDKILLGWNALMNIACSKAYMATGEEEYRDLATHNMKFILDSFRNEDTLGLYHSYKNGEAKFPAFLDDIAYLIQAMILLQEITGETEYLEKGKSLTEHVIAHFSEENGPFFYYTPKDQEDIIVRKKEIYDGLFLQGMQ